MPRRRCVGCGRVAPKSELVRLVAVPALAATDTRADAVLDRAGTLPGRGAYLCRLGTAPAPRRECLRAACRKGGLQRALRRSGELSVELLDAGP